MSSFKLLPLNVLAQNLKRRIATVKREHETLSTGLRITRSLFDSQDREAHIALLEGMLKDVECFKGQDAEEIAAFLVMAAALCVRDQIAKFVQEDSLRKYLYIFNDPNRSSMYRGMDEDLGINDKNPLDENTKRKAFAILRLYVLKNSAISPTEVPTLKNSFLQTYSKKYELFGYLNHYIHPELTAIKTKPMALKKPAILGEPKESKSDESHFAKFDKVFNSVKAEIKQFRPETLKHVEPVVKGGYTLKLFKIPKEEKKKRAHHSSSPTMKNS